MTAGAGGKQVAGSGGADVGAGGEEPEPTVAGFVWLDGKTNLDDPGVSGELGKPDPTYYPRARAYAGAPFDSTVTVGWVFGGESGTFLGEQVLSDLWKNEAGMWTLVAGSATPDLPGTYGQLGMPAPTNRPGGRSRAATWVDDFGDLWVFGGVGFGKDAAVAGDLADVWKYDGVQGAWVWISGSDSVGALRVEGVRDTAAPGNTPGGRRDAAFARRVGGPLWLFGGEMFPTAAELLPTKIFGDLWEFDDVNLTWRWRGGSYDGSGPMYGERGVPAPGNQPGARSGAAACLDSKNQLWLYGGIFLGRDGAPYGLNDLWRFDGSQWTWVTGEVRRNPAMLDVPLEPSPRGVPSATATPGGRAPDGCWFDANDNLYLFGGVDGFQNLWNDVWRFDGKNWAWLAGGDMPNVPANVGPKGAFSTDYSPGSCNGSVVWPELDGSAMILGGYGFSALPNASGNLTDWWRFTFAP